MIEPGLRRYAPSAFLLGALAMIGIVATMPFAMYDQGDFARMVSRAVGPALDPAPGFPAMHWAHAAAFPIPNPSSGIASGCFWLAALAQRLFRDDFSLLLWGNVAKTAHAFALLLLAFVLSAGFARRALAWMAIGIALLAVGFAPHNAAFFNSFYPEQVGLVALPLLLASLRTGMRGKLFLFAASLLALSLAKPQYACVPLLAAAVLWLDKASRPVSWRACLLACFIVQIAALGPLLGGDYAKVNRYNATYFGSYLVLDETERAGLELPPAARPCIGVDWWGNRIETAVDTDAHPSGLSCGADIAVETGQVLEPYVRYPQAMPRMLAAAARSHWTTDYFHVDRRNRYLRVNPGFREGLAARAMLRIDGLASRLAGVPMACILLLLACVLAFARWRRGRRFACCLFLAAFVVSQVLVALVGEGFRDLSKHLALAFYGIELLAVVAAAGICGLWHGRVRPAAA